MTDRTWEAGTGIEQIDDLINDHVEAAIKDVLDEDTWETYGYFPMSWYPNDGTSREGRAPAEALTFRVYSEGAGCSRDFDLWAELVRECESCEEDGSFAEGLAKIAARLHEMAARVDAAVRAAPTAEARLKEWADQHNNRLAAGDGMGSSAAPDRS